MTKYTMVMEIYIGKKEDSTALAVEHAADYINQVNRRDVEHRVLGLATGSSPIPFYRGLIDRIRRGNIDVTKWTTFNLDEYVLGFESIKMHVLDKATADVMGIDYKEPFDPEKVHVPEELQAAIRRKFIQTYNTFMVLNLFDNLPLGFKANYLPAGHLVEEDVLKKELQKFVCDRTAYSVLGNCDGHAIIIPENSTSDYLAWVQNQIIKGYQRRVDENGGKATLQVVGIGGNGHIAFHESNIPFVDQKGNHIKVMLLKISEDTTRNARLDGHFGNGYAPEFAISQGAMQVAESDSVYAFAWSKRKTEPLTRSLYGEVSPTCSASILQETAKTRTVRWYTDHDAAAEILHRGNLEKILAKRGIDCSVHILN